MVELVNEKLAAALAKGQGVFERPFLKEPPAAPAPPGATSLKELDVSAVHVKHFVVANPNQANEIFYRPADPEEPDLREHKHGWRPLLNMSVPFEDLASVRPGGQDHSKPTQTHVTKQNELLASIRLEYQGRHLKEDAKTLRDYKVDLGQIIELSVRNLARSPLTRAPRAGPTARALTASCRRVRPRSAVRPSDARDPAQVFARPEAVGEARLQCGGRLRPQGAGAQEPRELEQVEDGDALLVLRLALLERRGRVPGQEGGDPAGLPLRAGAISPHLALTSP